MKKRYSIVYQVIIVILLAFNFVSCSEFSLGNSFLNQEPEQIGVNIDTVFSKQYYAEQVLTRAYTTLHYGITQNRLGGDMLESLTDFSYSTCHYAGSRSLYYSGSYSAGNEGDKSKFLYTRNSIWTGIRYAWLMIENVDRVPDMSLERKKTAKAEAKMIIASHYVDLLRHFGGLPWIDHALLVNEEHNYPRETIEETVSHIVNLIDEAIVDLPWAVDEDNDGRITQAFAMGLKLRMLLFVASPLFNSDEPYMQGRASSSKMTWYGNYKKERWQAAKKAGEDFMKKLDANGMYSLLTASEETEEAYRKAFRDAYFTRHNGEILLSVRQSYKNNYQAHFCGHPNNYAAAQCPTLAYVNLFANNNGTDFPSDFNWENPSVDPFKDRDPRFYETILTNNRPYKGRVSQFYVGGEDRLTENTDGTGFGMYKFSQDYTPATSIGAVDCWPYMRLSEIYLSYAEAINEAEDAPNDIAYDCVNKVRARVGLPPLAKGLSKNEFRQAVLRERACELGYEECRWYDIIRWKNEDAFKADIQGLNMYKNSENPTGYVYKVFTIKPERTWKVNFSPKWYLSAFPTKEVDKNYGLVQNPGWE